MFELACKVLDYTGGQFTNDEGQLVKYSSAVIQTDDGVRSINSDLDLKEHVGGDEITLICKLEGSVKKPAKVRAVGLKD